MGIELWDKWVICQKGWTEVGTGRIGKMKDYEPNIQVILIWSVWGRFKLRYANLEWKYPTQSKFCVITQLGKSVNLHKFILLKEKGDPIYLTDPTDI